MVIYYLLLLIIILSYRVVDLIPLIHYIYLSSLRIITQNIRSYMSNVNGLLAHQVKRWFCNPLR